MLERGLRGHALHQDDAERVPDRVVQFQREGLAAAEFLQHAGRFGAEQAVRRPPLPEPGRDHGGRQHERGGQRFGLDGGVVAPQRRVAQPDQPR